MAVQADYFGSDMVNSDHLPFSLFTLYFAAMGIDYLQHVVQADTEAATGLPGVSFRAQQHAQSG